MASAKIQKRILYGIGASPGVAGGHVFIFTSDELKIPQYHIETTEIEDEINRYKKALKLAETQFIAIQKEIEAAPSNETSEIIEAHKFILKDELLNDRVKNLVRFYKMNAEWAVRVTAKEMKLRFASIKEQYFRERQEDVHYVTQRIIRNLLKHESRLEDSYPEDAILIAADLSPADTASLLKRNPRALLTAVGGRNSHTAIIARAMNIPAVMGLKDLTNLVGHGEEVLVDGSRGEVIINPDETDIKIYKKREAGYVSFRAELQQDIDLPTTTQEGKEIIISANIELEEELEHVISYRAGGIGLYRTEFLFTDEEKASDEETHFKVYDSIAGKMAPKPVTVRVFDLGGDKFDNKVKESAEPNPALGLRAIRFLLQNPEIFKNQVSGILRASTRGNLKILLPMVSGLDELKKCKALVEDTKKNLKKQSVPFDENIPLGIMIEIPSAAICAGDLAREVDFFSVGTNDLAQYLLAVDRMNEHVAHLYNAAHPAMLYILGRIMEAGHSNNIPVTICGEMAGDPIYTLVLIAMGFKELSMNPFNIPVIKKIVRSSSFEGARGVLDKVLEMHTAIEIETYLRQQVEMRFPEFSHWL